MPKYTIQVGPDPNHLHLVVNSGSPGVPSDEVEWRSDQPTNEGGAFKIRFPIAMASVPDAPFQNMHKPGPGHYWEFQLANYTGGICSSGPVNTVLATLPKGTMKRFKYDQHNRHGHADGWIVINP